MRDPGSNPGRSNSKIRSVADLFERIEKKRERLGISKRPTAWYRGQSSCEYSLLPSLLRNKNGLKHERNLFAIFKTKSAALINHACDSWELLAIMQHYGLPTKLLDWTESLHTALYFATLGKIDTPTIWILNPFVLNLHSTKKNIVFDNADKIDLDYYNSVCVEKAWPFEGPIAMDAPWKNDRIKSQRGSFTFHGTNTAPIEKLVPSCVAKVEIPPQLVRALRSDLLRSGIDDFRLFPDLDGLSKLLRNQFKV